MSVMGFQKKVWMWGGWVSGWGELYPSLFWIFGIWNLFNFPKPLTVLLSVLPLFRLLHRLPVLRHWSFALVRFVQLLRYADERLVNKKKVDIERNNMQVKLI